MLLSRFARNTGAIVGVAVASTCFIILAVILLFFLCKRRKGRHFWSGNFRSPAGLHFNPWQPPLAGDDDALYYAQNVRRHSNRSFQRLGSATHTSEMAQSGTELVGALHNIHELNSSESSLSHTQSRFLTHQTLSLSGRAEPEPVTPFPTDTYFMPPPSAWSEPLHGPLNADARSSLPSLYAGTSSNGHHHASTSSSHGHVCTPPSSHGHANEDVDMYASALSYGHAPTLSPSEHGLLSTNSSAARGASSLKDLVGRFRSSGNTLPTIQVDKVKSHSLPSWQSYHPPLSPPKAVSAMSLNRRNKPTLGPIEPHCLWPAATLPPLPSPTNTESSRMLENLLTPHIGTRIASSQHSSSASLRDHVDYTRPINGVCHILFVPLLQSLMALI
ncbi:hypothetical protein C0993_007582 [Termitomyces sp. T159_Od127]|nr:hypothetical protein C0993_007582 [Termitomyces sp. T159_Od127]